MSSRHDPPEMPPPGMRRMGTEVSMVIRGESLAHRLPRSRLLFLLVATLAASLAAFFRARHVEHVGGG